MQRRPSGDAKTKKSFMIKLSKTRGAAALLIGAVALSAMSFTAASAANCSYVFTKTLKKGSTGVEVMNLQKVLNMSAGTTVSASGAGSAGNETMTFGSATHAAVVKFQAANSVSPTSGLVGPLTRAKLNTMCSGTGTTTGTGTGTTTSGPVSVMSASSQPSGAIVAGQSGALLGNFVFSGNGTVSSVKFARTGISTNDTLTNVYLYDGAARLTDSASVSSDGTITFNNVNMTVNGSRTVSVRADIMAGTNGQIVGVNATSVMVAGASTMTAVNAAGPMLTIAQVTNIATVTLNNQKGIANTNLTLPQTNYTLWGNDLNVGQRAVNLKSITVKMIGSAPVSAVTNVALFVDGVQVATASADANQRFTFDLTSSPKSLYTGSHTVEVRGNVVAGASRNFYFTAENSADLMFEDSSLAGVNITPTNFNTYRTAGTQTISGTSATSIVVAKDTTFTVSNLVPGVSNTAISKFKVTAYGEDTKIQYITVVPKLNGVASTTAYLSNVGLFVNGGQVGNTINTGSTYQFSLGSNFIATAGTAYNVEVRADIRDRVTGLNFANGTVVTADVTAMEGQGQSSQNTFNNTLSVAGQNLTVGGTVVNVGKTISGVATSVSPNSTAVKIGSFQIQAGSIEGINVRQLTLGLTLASSTDQNLISNVTLKDGNGVTLGTPTGISSASQNFNVNFDVLQGATTKIDVYADLAGIATGNTIMPTLAVNYSGKTSNQTTTTTVVNGDTVVISVISVGAPTISSKLSSQYVLGGTNQTVGTYNVTSTNGKSTINDLTFSVTGAGVESVNVNGVTASPIGGTVLFSALNLAVPNGSAGVNIPVVVKYTPSYVGASGQPGVISGTTGTVTLTGMKTTTDSGTVTTTTPSVATNAMTLVATLPTVTKASTGTSVGVNGATQLAVKIGSIRVAADAAGDIILGTLSYNLSAPAAISNVVVKVGGTVAQDKLSANSTNTVTTAMFAAGYRITAGTSVVFDIFGDIAAVTNSGTADVSVGSAAAFLWSDDVASAGTDRAGTLLPSNKYVQ
jgi:Putative peptidoglycan binding domain